MPWRNRLFSSWRGTEEWGTEEQENGVRSSLSTFVHKLIEFKFELAPAVFFFCARDHLCDRSVGRATKQFANFSEPHPAAVPDQNHRNSSGFITFSSSLQELLFRASVNLCHTLKDRSHVRSTP